MQKLAFVTQNLGKFREVSSLLGVSLDHVSLDLDEIQSLDTHKIVHHKTLQAYNILKRPLFVDDTSLQVPAWNGFPGPFVKHIIEAGGPELLLTLMKGTEDRSAEFTTTIGYHNGNNVHFVEGTTQGSIAIKPRGGNTWGINTIFIPEHSEKTYGEMSVEEKNTLSHRAKAITSFQKLLQSQQT